MDLLRYVSTCHADKQKIQLLLDRIIPKTPQEAVLWITESLRACSDVDRLRKLKEKEKKLTHLYSLRDDKELNQRLTPIDVPFDWKDYAVDETPTPTNGFDWISEIFYLNLDRRRDRNEEFICEARRVELPLHSTFRFQAIEHQMGCYGASLSHIAMLELAIDRGVETLFVLEDDTNFHADVSYVHRSMSAFGEFARENQFQILLLSSHQATHGTTVFDPKKECSVVKRLIEGSCACSYVIHRSYMPTLLANLREGAPQLLATYHHWIFALDQHWKTLQREDVWMVFHPPLTYQRDSPCDTGMTPLLPSSYTLNTLDTDALVEGQPKLVKKESTSYPCTVVEFDESPMKEEKKSLNINPKSHLPSLYEYHAVARTHREAGRNAECYDRCLKIIHSTIDDWQEAVDEKQILAKEVWFELATVCYWIQEHDLGVRAVDRCLEFPELNYFSFQCLGFYAEPLKLEKTIPVPTYLPRHEFVPCNPSVIQMSGKTPNQYLFVVRHTNWIDHQVVGEMGRLVSKNFVSVMTEDMKIVESAELVDESNRKRSSTHWNGLEDCRLYLAEVDRIRFLCTILDHEGGSTPQMAHGQASYDAHRKIWSVTKIIPLCRLQSNGEKNWLVIPPSNDNDDNEKIRIIHHWYPFRTLVVDLKHQIGSFHIELEQQYPFGKLSQGSCAPLRWSVDDDDEGDDELVDKKFAIDDDEELKSKFVKNVQCTSHPLEGLAKLHDIPIKTLRITDKKEYFLALVHESYKPTGNQESFYHRLILLNSKMDIVKRSHAFCFFKHQLEYSCGWCYTFDKKSILIGVGVKDSEASIVQVSCETINSMLMDIARF